MGTTLSTLAPPKGATHRRKRVGRGYGSGSGTTSGRGQKGQGSRSGPDLGRGFEGGQMPLQRRLPKRGFKNPFRVEYEPINVGKLADLFDAGSVIDPEAMKSRGLAPRKANRLKILGSGDVAHALTVKAHAFSKTAVEKIQAVGGTVEIISKKGAPKEAQVDRE
jgi:large subunit ribosomal protein L15